MCLGGDAMTIVRLEEIQIIGISVRTINADEMNPETSKIGKLYQRFDQNVTVNYKDGARVYGVYFNYESGASGEFSVLAGSDRIESNKEKLEMVTIPAGKYMVFEGKGDVPRVVFETWEKIWDYFSNDSTLHKRAYTTDFEHYRSPEEVDIYIAIQ
jgi:predicted transcriptional regulator YdeE